MNPTLAVAALLSSGCALASTNPDSPLQVFSRSHNRSDVDVYLSCGARDARWLGVVSQKGAEGFEIPAQEAQCVQGLSFFLMVRDQGRGYWVGPVRPRGSANVTLVIEKYAGLSYAGMGESASLSAER
jgi:hypothetical protein